MTVLVYFDAFESYLAQLEDYDESFYLAKFIFGLQPALLTHVFAQHPATLLDAKVLAETVELTQSMMKSHQNPQKKTIKAAQHRDTQKRRSGRPHQSIQRGQMKTCRVKDRYQKIDLFGKGCISTIEEHVRLAIQRFMD